VSPVFSILKEELTQLTDPGNGVFLMDFPFFTGLLGFNYNLWKAATSTELDRTYRGMINKFPEVKVDAQKQLTIDINNGGSFIHIRVI
jgi:hypothetical protein